MNKTTKIINLYLFSILHASFRMPHLLIFTVLFSTVTVQAQDYPKREMRAVWVSTVYNIDWPSSSTLTPELQQQEMIELLNRVKAYNMNTVVFQVRPSADAFYQSVYELWSQWLTGTQGEAPNPCYDPLHFTIAEARKRGIGVHVWMNPYRAITNNRQTAVNQSHITQTHPHLFVKYGNSTYFNPGLDEVRNHVATVVSDIVRRYDIDAIHFDDYFYPYPIARSEFPDNETFINNLRGFAIHQKDEWRRNNVDLIIRQLRDSIKNIKPYVEFGISPFGVWRNSSSDVRGSATKAGITSFDSLYANILKWQEEGWIDYVVPQIYWHIGKDVADYAVIADWWSRHANGCKLYIGHAMYRIDRHSPDREWRTANELVKQIKLNRLYPNIAGSFFFSANVLQRNPLKMQKKLMRQLYRYPALPPVNVRVEQQLPLSPTEAKLQVTGNEIILNWKGNNNNKMYVIYKVKKSSSTVSVSNAKDIVIVTSSNRVYVDLTRNTSPHRYHYIVTALSKTNLESDPVLFTE